jgi:hypothetical protein
VNDDPVWRTLDQADIGTLVDLIRPLRRSVAGHRQNSVDEILLCPRRLPVRKIAEFTAEDKLASSDLNDEVGIFACIVVIVII